MNPQFRRTLRDAVYNAFGKVYGIKEPYTDRQNALCEQVLTKVEETVKSYLKERKK